MNLCRYKFLVNDSSMDEAEPAMKSPVHSYSISERAFPTSAGTVSSRERHSFIACQTEALVANRLHHRLQRLGLPDFDAYCDLITNEETSDERRLLVDFADRPMKPISFARPAHFDHLITKALPARCQAGLCESGAQRHPAVKNPFQHRHMSLAAWPLARKAGRYWVQICRPACWHMPNAACIAWNVCNICPKLCASATACVARTNYRAPC